MVRSNFKSDEFSSKKIYVWCLLISLIFTSFFVYFIDYPNRDRDKLITKEWLNLMTKSEGHRVIVTSYLECVKKPFGSSRSECQLNSLEYGRARKIINSEVVFNEIVSLSEKIRSI